MPALGSPFVRAMRQRAAARPRLPGFPGQRSVGARLLRRLRSGAVNRLLGVPRRPRGARPLRGRAHVDPQQGYLNGAVESGQRAAREVLQAIT